MAIGLGLIMGFSFPQNFNYPYISKSITEFWRRWHMSLSSWFRDYLYIPLGGNRVSPFRTYINLMVVFLLCGLWHGAAWTFIIWGAYHGFFLILERLGFKKLLDTSWRLFSHTYTLFVVVIGWVIFRAEDFNHLVYFLKTMFGLGQGQTIEFVPSLYLTSSLSVTLIFATVFSMPIYHFLFRQMNMKEYLQIDIKVTILKIMFEMYYISIFLLSLLNIASGSYNPFIYFRF